MAERSDDERCQILTEVAVEQAMEKCGSEEAVRNQLRRIIGLSEDYDPDCEAALEEGLNEETLASTRGTRQWVMCRAWDLVREEDRTLSAAVSQAWAEAQAEGEKQDIEV